MSSIDWNQATKREEGEQERKRTGERKTELERD